MTKFSIPIALTAGLIMTAAPTLAAQCAQRDRVTERLQSKYSEELTARGLQSINGGAAVVEIWASVDTGTFTVLLTNAHGQTCVISSGTHWFPEVSAKLVKTPKGSPS